jgi:hypothetical protein
MTRLTWMDDSTGARLHSDIDGGARVESSVVSHDRCKLDFAY